MSLAETAELAAHIQLTGVGAYTSGAAKVMAANRGVSGSAATMGKTIGAIGGHLKSGLGAALTNITKIGVIAGAALGVGLAAQIRSGIDSLQELEQVTAQTNAVLKSTRGAAGLNAAAIAKLSEKYEDLNATIDNKVIQSAENLLLTFTSIRKDAFEPALKAALDMNEAMGGGEGGLQSTIIQVGKALQDPIKGITALRRVGVNFSEQQTKQIKDLIKHNKLYEAQQLILRELTKEFGGSFAAAGKTASGTFASLGDAIEDIQMNLTRALLPALTEVAEELTTVAKDPAFLKGVEDFGKGLAGAFRNAVTFAKQVPWKEIGAGLQTAASAAGHLVDAFVAAPDWLKTAVITGWGLNKLTGGMLTNIGGDIAKGIGSQFLGRGSSPANPLWVASVGGPGVPGVPGGKPGGAGLLGALAIGAGTDLALTQATDPNNPVRHDFNQMTGQLKQMIGSFRAGLFGGGAGVGAAGGGVGVTSGTTALKAFTAAVLAGARAIEKDWLSSIDPDKIGARSKAATGRNATPAQIAATRSRDILHQIAVITQKSKASSDVKLARLQELVRAGDPKTRSAVNKAIRDMKAKIAAEQARTTAAVSGGAAAIIGAIAQHESDLNVYVTTNVTANSVTRATTSVARYGNTGGDRRYDP